MKSLKHLAGFAAVLCATLAHGADVDRTGGPQQANAAWIERLQKQQSFIGSPSSSIH